MKRNLHNELRLYDSILENKWVDLEHKLDDFYSLFWRCCDFCNNNIFDEKKGVILCLIDKEICNCENSRDKGLYFEVEKSLEVFNTNFRVLVQKIREKRDEIMNLIDVGG